MSFTMNNKNFDFMYFSWWRHLRSSKLGYIRDRVVEAYLCTITWFFEPCYSLGRIISAKLTILSSVMDDTFDSYASFEEILLFNDAIQRLCTKNVPIFIY